MTQLPTWLIEAEAAKARGEAARTRAADERALWILKGYEGYGRGGREKVAEMLDISVGEVAKYLARARGLDRPTALPPADELLERLYALELAEVEPMPALHGKVLAHLVRSTVIEVTWLHNPGGLLADEVEDIDPGELPEGADQAALAQACRSWTRVQALAVIDALTRGVDLAAKES